MPVLVNLFGTVKRVAMGVTLDGQERTTAGELREVGELLAFLRAPAPPRGRGDPRQGRPAPAPEHRERVWFASFSHPQKYFEKWPGSP